MSTNRNEKLNRRSKIQAFKFASLFLLLVAFIPHIASSQNSVVGTWDAPVQLEIDGVHGVVLPNGKVLYLPHREDPITGATMSAVFDPDNPAAVNYIPASRNYFCGGHSMMADGRVLFNGGDYNALNSSGYFDYQTETWDIDSNTNRDRWYPSTIQLGDGTAWTFGGQNSPADVETNDETIEFYDPLTGNWTMAGGQGIPQQYVEAYNRLHLLPDGRIFQSGHNPETYIYDPVARAWEFIANTNYGLPRGDGSSVRLQDGRIMIVGGYQEKGAGFPTASAEVIDLSQPNPTWQTLPNMNEPRAFQDTVVLPDGNVFVVGGFFDDTFVPELYNPTTNTWTDMAPHTITRGYHSTALLLPDGRVICSGGTDNNGPGLFKESAQFEIWNPYYLFSSSRPVIDNMPTAANYGQQISLNYSSSVPVSHVVIHRTGEQTHSFSYNQISVPVDFNSNDGTNVTFTVPANANVLPPSFYMVFLMSNDGVPSVAKWLQVGSDIGGVLLGDVNLDGTVNLLDVQPFVNRVSMGQFQEEADTNQDGVVNLLDVQPFVAILSGN